MAERRRKLNRDVFITFEIGPYTAMVAMLLVFFFCIPFTTEGTVVNLGLNALVVATLIGAVYLSWPRPWAVVLGVLLGFIAMVPMTGRVGPVGPTELAAHSAAFCLMLIAVVAILSHVLTVERVTLDILIGAASVYLFIGLLWGAMFALLEYWFPGSFHFPKDIFVGGPTALLPLQRDTILLYYSYETLTTLGYGDVLPSTPPSRFLSILEAMVGQLYLAVLVGRLVSLQLLHGRRGGSENGS